MRPLFDRYSQLSDDSLQPGDRVVIYTDGFTESFDSHEAELGIDGFSQIVREASLWPLPEMKQQILDRVAAFRSGPPRRRYVASRRQHTVGYSKNSTLSVPSISNGNWLGRTALPQARGAAAKLSHLPTKIQAPLR